MKKILKLIFYVLVGTFYRMDIRKFFFTDGKNGYVILNLPSYKLYADNTVVSASKRLLNEKMLSFKTKLNLNRILFGQLPYHKCLSVINYDFFRMYFLDDTHLGHRLEKPDITGYTYYKGLLNFLKRFTDYSNQLYISREDLEKIKQNYD